MRTLLALCVVATGAAAVAANDPPAVATVPVATEVPAGSFQSAWVKLSGTAWPKVKNKPGFDEFPVRLTFRAGKGTSAWICSPLVANSFTTWIDRTDLVLNQQELKGTLAGVTHAGLGTV